MTSYETYLNWKPVIAQFQESGIRSKRAFCSQHQLNYQAFLLVCRNIERGMILPPKTESVKQQGPPVRPDPKGQMKFFRVTVRRKNDHESQF